MAEIRLIVFNQIKHFKRSVLTTCDQGFTFGKSNRAHNLPTMQTRQ